MNTLPGALHRGLRSATSGDHRSVDRMMTDIDLSGREGYRRFLSIHYAALQLFEPDWRDQDSDDFHAMVHCLRDDLGTLDGPSATGQPAERPVLNAGNRVGIAYVIRGSRLGSAILRRRVPIGFAASYFDFSPATSWTQFLEQLDQYAAAPGGSAECDAILGAKVAFGAFAGLISGAAGRPAP
jgi:heme oxygenase